MTTEYAVIEPANPQYPEGLRSIVPDTQLYAVGNLDLLGKRAMGMCGSRDASPEAQQYAFRFGKEAAQKGFVVVSGYARGVDRQAHKGALVTGGDTIAVLAEGIAGFRLVTELAPFIDLDENFLAVSAFEPHAVWKSWRAMQRNKLIVGLSVGSFVIEARETGGTINAAMECVRQKKPLWAVAYSKDLPGREGNRKLVQGSAIPLRHQCDLLKALEESALDSQEELKQLALSL